MMTTKEITDRAFALGYQAAERNESRAPVQSQEFMDMMRSNHVAEWDAPLLAFAHGYDAQRKAAADSGEPAQE